VYRILELIHSLPRSSNAVLKETLIFDNQLIVTFMATIVYRVSWLHARAILCLERNEGVGTLGRRTTVTRLSAPWRVGHRREADEQLLVFGCLRALLRFRTLVASGRQRGVHPGPL
jgi:hypothetical protein